MRLIGGKRELLHAGDAPIIKEIRVTPVVEEKEESAHRPDAAYFRSTLFFAASFSSKLCN